MRIDYSHSYVDWPTSGWHIWRTCAIRLTSRAHHRVCHSRCCWYRHGCPLSESRVDFCEIGSPYRCLVPTLHHERVHSWWTFLRARKKLTRTNHFNYFLIAISIIWLNNKITSWLIMITILSKYVNIYL